MSKVTVVGAGNVGATCVNAMAIRETAGEIVLLDIKEGLAEGKVLDMYQTSTLMDFDTNLLGVTNDYAKTAGSDVVVITSGMPRKPGMSREDLIGVNAGIVKDVVTNILKYSPDAILLIVSNPMDTMTTLAQKVRSAHQPRIRHGRRAGQRPFPRIPRQSARCQRKRRGRHGHRRTRRHDHDSARQQGIL